MHQKQARDKFVRGEGIASNGIEPTGIGQQLEESFQPGPVEIGDQGDQILPALLGHWPRRAQGTQQAIDPLAGLAEMIKRGGLSLSKSVVEPFDGLRAHAHSPVTDWVGECSSSSFLPPPRYMCTPHGRQGSKLRTVRITSMPLKCSRSFSSKIG
jgi:hypothetical protein